MEWKVAGRFKTGGTGISVQFSCSLVSDSLQPHGMQHARFPCPSPTPGACSDSCPLSQWCHLTISSSATPLLLLPLVFSTSGSFPMSRLYISGGQRIGISALASVLPMNTQDQFPLGLTGWISLQSKGLLWLINVDEWQKSTQHCKAIIWDGWNWSPLYRAK